MVFASIGSSAGKTGMKMAEEMARLQKARMAAGLEDEKHRSIKRVSSKVTKTQPATSKSDDTVLSGVTESSSNSKKSGIRGLFRRSKKEDTTSSPASAIPTEVVASGETTAETTMSVVSKKQQEGEKTLILLENTIESQENALTKMSRDEEDSKQLAKEKLKEGNKRSALRHMKKAKRCQMESDRINSVLESLEQMQLSIERAVENLKVMEALQQGSKQLTSLQGGNTVTELDALMDSIRDSNDIALEVNELLSADVSAVILDDDDLMEELEQEMGTLDLDLPEVPTRTTPTSTRQEPRAEPTSFTTKRAAALAGDVGC
eukprot:Nitzschia sp. Nitz4//scaffold101_size76361//12221//13177//NITZ4_005594-RA/size76361-processed-gene-0.28-mRNA-1//-1//CDS//3329532134//6559//frame0